MKNTLYLIVLILSFSSFAQQKLALKDVDQNKILKEIVYTSANNDQLTILYWFPEIYWEILSAKDPKSVSPELVSQLKEILGNKSIFLAVSGSLNNTTRKFDAKDESYMRSNISVALHGKTYKPIPNSKLTEDMKLLNDYLKPMFGRMMGEMGAGMTIFYFEITDNTGQNLLNAYSDIDFTYSLAASKANFHLPLPSLFTDSKCANDGELFPANYEFCPYHGSKLITQ